MPGQTHPSSHLSFAPLNQRPTIHAPLLGTRNDPERTLPMTSGTPYDRILRDLEREVSHYERSLAKQQQPKKPPAPLPTAHFLSNVPSKPLNWLWPGRIPLGHLTLLD